MTSIYGYTQPPTPKVLANFMINDLAGICKRKGFEIGGDRFPINPVELGYMLRLMEDGHLERKDVRLWCMEVLDRAKEIIQVIHWCVDYMVERQKKHAYEN